MESKADGSRGEGRFVHRTAPQARMASRGLGQPFRGPVEGAVTNACYPPQLQLRALRMPVPRRESRIGRLKLRPPPRGRRFPCAVHARSRLPTKSFVPQTDLAETGLKVAFACKIPPVPRSGEGASSAASPESGVRDAASGRPRLSWRPAMRSAHATGPESGAGNASCAYGHVPTAASSTASRPRPANRCRSAPSAGRSKLSATRSRPICPSATRSGGDWLPRWPSRRLQGCCGLTTQCAASCKNRY